MVMASGMKGYKGKSLVRDTKAFQARMNEIDFSRSGIRSRKPDRTTGGKKTYVYK